MNYRILGRTGVQVSKLCLGAMMFGPWGTRTTTTEFRTIHRALDAGINFVDTADVYSQVCLRRSWPRPCRAAATTSSSRRSSMADG